MFDENSNSTTASAATLAALSAAATSSANSTTNATAVASAAAAAAAAPVNQTHLMSQLMNAKDSRWLQLEVCREFLRGQCSRNDVECKFAHPPPHVDVQNGRVTACYDSIKGRCTRENPKCKYLHPPQHLKDQLLINGKNTLAIKNLIANQLQNSGAAAAALAPALPVNLSQLIQQQQQQQQPQHPALVQAVPFQYYPHLFQYPMLPQNAADLYNVQAQPSATLAAQQQLALFQAQQQLQQQSSTNPLLAAVIQQQQQQQQQAQLAASLNAAAAAAAAAGATPSPLASLDSRKRTYRAAALDAVAVADGSASGVSVATASGGTNTPSTSIASGIQAAAAASASTDPAMAAAIHQQILIAAAANGGPIPMKRPADKNATAGMPMYSPQAAAAAANFNPYLPIPGYMPAVSSGMEVPQHIYVNGGHRMKHNSFSGSGINDGVSARDGMNVPNRIVLGGGDTHFAGRQGPTEVMADMVSSLPKLHTSDVPAVITANDFHKNDVVSHRSAMSETSIAIDENPLRELKLMRRQLGRLSTRVMQLEDENGRRNTRETSLWITLLGSIAVIVTLLTRKNFRF